MTVPDFLLPFGPLHIVFLHLPIGGLVAIWFVLFVLPNQGQKHKEPVIGLLHLFLLIVTVLTIVLGLAYETYGQYEEELERHELWGYIFGGVVIGNFVCYWLHRIAGKVKTKYLYFFSLIVATVAMIVTSHEGGELVHGKGFLLKPFRKVEEKPVVTRPAEATQVVESVAVDKQPGIVSIEQGGMGIDDSIVEIDESSTMEMDDSSMEMSSAMEMSMMGGTVPPMPVSEALVSDESIKRFEAAELVFKNHCYNCHGATKQKGDLRLDHEEAAFAGGDAGAISIVPHDAEGSLIVERMRLPREHDDAMPPEKKPAVSAEGIEAVVAWIQAGAVWPDMRARDKRELNYVEIDDEQTAKLIDQLNATGAKAEYNSWDDARVRVDLSFTDEDKLEAAISQLGAFGDKLIWLDAGGLKLPEAFYQQLLQFSNLERLHLDRSNVTEMDLKGLVGSSKLSYLNLFDTEISDSSLEVLLKLPNLEKVFLTDTKVTKAGVDKLVKEKSTLEVIHR